MNAKNLPSIRMSPTGVLGSIILLTAIAAVFYFRPSFRRVLNLAQGISLEGEFIKVEKVPNGDSIIKAKVTNLSFEPIEIHNLTLPCSCIVPQSETPLQIEPWSSKELTFDIKKDLDAKSSITFLTVPNVRTTSIELPPVYVER